MTYPRYSKGMSCCPSQVGKFHDLSAGLLIGGKDVQEEQKFIQGRPTNGQTLHVEFRPHPAVHGDLLLGTKDFQACAGYKDGLHGLAFRSWFCVLARPPLDLFCSFFCLLCDLRL